MILRLHFRRRLVQFIPVAAIALAGAILQVSPAEASVDKSVVTPAAADLDSRAYLATLTRISAAVQKLPTHPDAIAPLRASLPKSWRVAVGAQHTELSAEWLDSALATMQTSPATRAQVQKDILAHLKILEEQAEALVTSGTAANTNARPRLTAILQRSEFGSVQPPSWWQTFTARIGRWVRRVLTKLFGGMGKQEAVRKIFVWSSIIALFILLAWILGRALVRTAKHTELELGTPLPAGKSWRAWAQDALAAAQQSRFREAVHCGYWAGVYRLQDLGALKLERARTPREYLRMLEPTASNSAAPAQLAPAPAADYCAPLAKLTRKLELTWYGCQPATKDDFAETIENLEALGCRFPSGQPIAGS